MELLSIVIPCYNEEEMLPRFYAEICRVSDAMLNCRFEFIFVDDGSTDRTLAMLKDFCRTDDRVKWLSFSRNFGKEAALLAGLRTARGQLVAVIDADLQDPPDMLADMYGSIKAEGYDCAAAKRMSRDGEPLLRSMFARMFYWMMRKISKINMVSGARDFRLMTRKVVDAILSMPETGRFSKGIFGWVGFKTKWLPYEHIPRTDGKTKFSFTTLFRYSLDGVFSFSQAPIALASVFGLALFLLSALFLIFIAARRLIWGDPVSGWASTVCIILFIGSAQFFYLSLIGQYISRMFLEIKNRPMYFIRESDDDFTRAAAADTPRETVVTAHD
ncbi:MAG: glycosyltransferase family 2 protein [Oscillospiraceae bacterium]|jgi:glycosyltransferase involved in cell wall biosynthesis|nr:glycosyltransferase family 2 protein [Oscillospiraceae bacterium]